MRKSMTHETTSPQADWKRSIVTIAYVDALLFAIHLVTYFIPAIRDATTSSSIGAAELLALIAVSEHALLLPIVSVLPAPNWGRYAGYGWLVIDIATDIMQLNNAPKAAYLTMRYGGHIAAAIWIASASWQAKGAIRVIGLILAIDLAIYSFIAFIPITFIILIPSLILLPLWIVLVGRRLAM